jgi:hypothetical protein
VPTPGALTRSGGEHSFPNAPPRALLTASRLVFRMLFEGNSGT